jgi:hypothetical protein
MSTTHAKLFRVGIESYCDDDERGTEEALSELPFGIHEGWR